MLRAGLRAQRGPRHTGWARLDLVPFATSSDNHNLASEARPEHALGRISDLGG